MPSQGPPSKWLDYYRLMAENPAGFKSMVEKNIETLSEDIKRDAANVDAYVKRGAAYVGLYTYWGVAEDVGSVELAIVDFSKAIELDPSNPDAYIGRVRLPHIGSLQARLSMGSPNDLDDGS